MIRFWWKTSPGNLRADGDRDLCLKRELGEKYGAKVGTGLDPPLGVPVFWRGFVFRIRVVFNGGYAYGLELVLFSMV